MLFLEEQTGIALLWSSASNNAVLWSNKDEWLLVRSLHGFSDEMKYFKYFNLKKKGKNKIKNHFKNPKAVKSFPCKCLLRNSVIEVKWEILAMVSVEYLMWNQGNEREWWQSWKPKNGSGVVDASGWGGLRHVWLEIPVRNKQSCWSSVTNSRLYRTCHSCVREREIWIVSLLVRTDRHWYSKLLCKSKSLL